MRGLYIPEGRKIYLSGVVMVRVELEVNKSDREQNSPQILESADRAGAAVSPPRSER